MEISKPALNKIPPDYINSIRWQQIDYATIYYQSFSGILASVVSKYSQNLLTVSIFTFSSGECG